jgi:hypothetical protein
MIWTPWGHWKIISPPRKFRTEKTGKRLEKFNDFKNGTISVPAIFVSGLTPILNR